MKGLDVIGQNDEVRRHWKSQLSQAACYKEWDGRQERHRDQDPCPGHRDVYPCHTGQLARDDERGS